MTRTYRWTEEGLARRKAANAALHADPAFKAKTSARMKALHADPAFRAKLETAAHQRVTGLSVSGLKIYYRLRDRGVDETMALRQAVREQASRSSR
jgi:hypothetical protein